jgi:hypothetical protein
LRKRLETLIVNKQLISDEIYGKFALMKLLNNYLGKQAAKSYDENRGVVF